VLEVRIHDSDVGCSRGEHPFNTGGRKTAPSDALNYADTGIGTRDFPDSRSGTVWRVIVYEDEFPPVSLKRRGQSCDKLSHALDFVEGWDHNCQVGSWHGNEGRRDAMVGNARSRTGHIAHSGFDRRNERRV
jgi:hypothetical protein